MSNAGGVSRPKIGLGVAVLAIGSASGSGWLEVVSGEVIRAGRTIRIVTGKALSDFCRKPLIDARAYTPPLWLGSDRPSEAARSRDARGCAPSACVTRTCFKGFGDTCSFVHRHDATQAACSPQFIFKVEIPASGGYLLNLGRERAAGSGRFNYMIRLIHCLADTCRSSENMRHLPGKRLPLVIPDSLRGTSKIMDFVNIG